MLVLGYGTLVPQHGSQTNAENIKSDKEAKYKRKQQK
jgi:hypothetical protein